jgi:hypothetical protein
MVDMVTVKNWGGSVPTMFFTVSCMARTTCRQGRGDGAVNGGLLGDAWMELRCAMCAQEAYMELASSVGGAVGVCAGVLSHS